MHYFRIKYIGVLGILVGAFTMVKETFYVYYYITQNNIWKIQTAKYYIISSVIVCNVVKRTKFNLFNTDPFLAHILKNFGDFWASKRLIAIINILK